MTAREVELTGGAPWGFRMHGGVDQNQPLRISRVNPGRKASLSGIREGDVISSINGRATKDMSNSDAHAMLRSAGPVLRLGLNEDRDMSPRRRSIGKGSELKRPSQLIAEVQNTKAIPQAPVYATIRPSQSPQHRPLQSPLRGSLNSLPTELYSTQLVKSVAQNEEPIKFHPTNPFFITIPSNHSNVSKLPIRNSRVSLSSLDRNKIRDTLRTDYNSDLKSPALNSKTIDSGASSLPCYKHESEITNGYELLIPTTISEKTDHFTYSPNQGLRKNPFDAKRNSDPFEKYLRQNSKSNGTCDYDTKNMSNSISDNNFHLNEEVTKRSMITEHKISEVEEVKTIKKIVMNGCDDPIDKYKGRTSESANAVGNTFDVQTTYFTNCNSTLTHQSPRINCVLSTPIQDRNEYFTTFNQNERDPISIRTHDSANKEKSDKIVNFS